MRLFCAFFSAIDALNEWLYRYVSWAIFAIIVSIAYEVVARYLFSSPSKWVFEFTYLVHGPYFLLLGAYTFQKGGHVGVDILHARLSRRGQAILDLITAPVFFFVCLVMLKQGWTFFWSAWEVKETLSSAWAPPVWPIKFVIPVSAALLLLQGVVKYGRSIYYLVKGREGP